MLIPLWVTSPSWCTAVLAAAPVFAAVRLLQMRELAQGATLHRLTRGEKLWKFQRTLVGRTK